MGKGSSVRDIRVRRGREVKKLDDEWPESIFHHVGSPSVSFSSRRKSECELSVKCSV